MTAGLVVDSITVHFGGNVAVDHVSLEATRGRITGLIGPNGAGKTTTFNVCSGLTRPSGGRVSLLGHDVTRMSPPSRARLGLGRTFQRLQLYRSMTVRENVIVGREAGLAGRNPLRHLVGRTGDRAATARAVDEAIDRCGIGAIGDRTVASLSTGEQRLVELARACVADSAILLLDEPSSGLDVAETQRFGDILVQLVRDKDVGILIVEHDMALVMRTCDYLYVLDFGTLIFDGDTAAVTSSEIVRTAYLGDEVGLEPTC